MSRAARGLLPSLIVGAVLAGCAAWNAPIDPELDRTVRDRLDRPEGMPVFKLDEAQAGDGRGKPQAHEGRDARWPAADEPADQAGGCPQAATGAKPAN